MADEVTPPSPRTIRVLTPGCADVWATFDNLPDALAFIRQRWGSQGRWDRTRGDDMMELGVVGAPRVDPHAAAPAVSTSSRTLQVWSVSPAATAGVHFSVM